MERLHFVSWLESSRLIPIRISGRNSGTRYSGWPVWCPLGMASLPDDEASYFDLPCLWGCPRRGSRSHVFMWWTIRAFRYDEMG